MKKIYSLIAVMAIAGATSAQQVNMPKYPHKEDGGKMSSGSNPKKDGQVEQLNLKVIGQDGQVSSMLKVPLIHSIRRFYCFLSR